MNIFRQITETLKNGGTTYHMGYPVAVEDVWCVATSGVVTDVFNAYKELKQFTKRNNGAVIGTWIDNDKIYIDRCVLIEDKNKAIRIAKKFNQLAIYNLKTQITINL